MSKVEIVPATSADIAEFTTMLYGEPSRVKMRVRALAGKIDGRVVAVGGIEIRPDGTRVAFFDRSDEISKYPITMHRAARMVMDMAAKLGVKKLVATASDHPAAKRWLARLNFEPQNIDGNIVYVRDF
jgi:hypothetical protein